MKITKEQYDRVATRIERLEKAINGGKGSGNFGHSGRPGQVGGSGKQGSSSSGKTKEEQKDTSFHSRYEGGTAPISYDGDTFYPDKDGRGMTTKDGKRSMMFPDEILYARKQMVDDWQKRGLTETSYEQAKTLWARLYKDSLITDQDMRDKKTAIELASELGTIVRKYEEEHPEVYLK